MATASAPASRARSGVISGHRIGQREDERVRRHRTHHLRRQHAAGRETDEDVGAGDDVAERAGAPVLVRQPRDFLLGEVHVLRAALVDGALPVAEDDVADTETRAAAW